MPTEPTTGDDRTFNYPDPVLVGPGRPAVLMLAWTSMWCTAPVSTDRVRVSLPDDGGAFRLKFGWTLEVPEQPGTGLVP